jgi:hypothetical protein
MTFAPTAGNRGEMMRVEEVRARAEETGLQGEAGLVAKRRSCWWRALGEQRQWWLGEPQCGASAD